MSTVHWTIDSCVQVLVGDNSCTLVMASSAEGRWQRSIKLSAVHDTPSLASLTTRWPLKLAINNLNISLDISKLEKKRKPFNERPDTLRRLTWGLGFMFHPRDVKLGKVMPKRDFLRSQNTNKNIYYVHIGTHHIANWVERHCLLLLQCKFENNRYSQGFYFARLVFSWIIG